MVANVVKQVRLTLGLGLIATACVSPATQPARITAPKSAESQKPTSVAPTVARSRAVGQPVRIALPSRSSEPTINDGARSAPPEMVAALRSIWASFPGKTGIAVMKTDGSWMVSYRGDEPMPQQSVSKLWVAISVMDAVDKGQLSLDDQVTLKKSDITVFHQPIAGLIGPNGYTTTVASLLKRAMTQSDNTANDFLMRRVGGPTAIRELIASKRLGAIRFGPGERHFQAATAGLTWKQEYSFAGAFNTARAALPPATRKAAMDRYVSDPMDGATPAAIARSLARLKRGELLSPQSTRYLINMMESTTTGRARLKAGVPAGWKLAHKTGTGQDLRNRTAGFNDVGIMIAPDGTSYAVAVLIADTTAPVPARQKLIQQVASTVAANHKGGEYAQRSGQRDRGSN